ncbi:type II toxin-antitoxin system YafQ family toxin [Bifidobacterium sp. ESL0769]|uniref:type II toxin-antitoxin system RelE/ParE family toxin n=1 Tax=Bifidobacterium sp. ESL0769 TaxID=2983229 RepID=UPI0023F7601E|nr:type II toxin-antitoxin system YafQ family toxin [Bifidobacterium sp. ESL0769]WEV67282.1 type II toxin-antitoxin system YafQ family toxin [Bifidobacterium sp. ESL0769]
MREIAYNPAFLRDVKRLKRKHYDMSKLLEVEKVLRRGDATILTTQYKDHRLVGNLSPFRELHIAPDWLLVYRVDGEKIILARTGSHDGLL